MAPAASWAEPLAQALLTTTQLLRVREDVAEDAEELAVARRQGGGNGGGLQQAPLAAVPAPRARLKTLLLLVSANRLLRGTPCTYLRDSAFGSAGRGIPSEAPPAEGKGALPSKRARRERLLKPKPRQSKRRSWLR